MKTPVLSEKIVRDLEGTILDGQLKAGDRLPTEYELTERYATSRPVVREAIRELKACGLVVSKRGSGCYVAEKAWEAPLRVSMERYGMLRGDSMAYDDLLDLRMVLEVHCIRRLVKPEAGKARAKLAAKLAAMEVVKNDLIAFGKADLAFHFEIVNGAGNMLFTTIYEGLLPGLGQRFARTTYTNLDLAEHTLVDHRAINQAVQARDEEGAVKHLIDHINWSRVHMHEICDPIAL